MRWGQDDDATALYRWDSAQLVADSDGKPRTYPSGQPMAWPARVEVGPRGVGGPQTAEVLLSIRQRTTNAGQTVLLPQEAVQALHGALRGRHDWTSPAEGQGTYADLRWDGSAILSVVGYGHEWKRHTVSMPVEVAAEFAEALADWLAHGWTNCRRAVEPTPVKPVPTPRRPSCRPTGDLAEPGEPLDSCAAGHRLACAVCQTPLRLEWRAALGDWVELDDDGQMFGSVKPPVGENGYESWVWLREQLVAGDDRAAGAHSMLGVVLEMTGDPYSHRHRLPAAGYDGRSEQCGRGCRRPPRAVPPPECCGTPMWLTGEGWRCRQGRVTFPFDGVAA